jgi:outer membrane protein OmpA-like peptidoglycan-associated protein
VLFEIQKLGTKTHNSKPSIIMPKSILLLSLVVIMSLPLSAQQNPRINKDAITFGAKNKKKAKKEYSLAEKYYRKGIGTYDEALKYYLRLYRYKTDEPALNYKIGACHLFTSNKKASLDFLKASNPKITKDYYYLLGRSYQYNLMYDEAKEAFEQHFNSLSKWGKKEKQARLNQLKRECTFGKEAVKDSTPVFITNLGPLVNTYYDEYGAILAPWDSSVYFTSRRPKNEPKKRVSRYNFKERILFAENALNDKEVSVSPVKNLKSSINVALSGINENQQIIYYYKGKKQTGDIHSAKIKNGKAKKKKGLNGKVNHIAYQETSITVAEDGSTYFISDRRGGEGGKDIWYSKQKRKNRFKKRKNLGDLINTSFDEECVYVTPDGQTLYFSSNGHEGMGGFDVFKSEKQNDGSWSKPINLGYPINSPADELFYHPTKDPNIALYSAIRPSGHGGFDIYEIKKDKRSPFTLSGIVTDKKSGDTLQASVNIYNTLTNELTASTQTNSITGIYSTSFKDTTRYLIQVDAEKYKTLSDSIICPKERHAKVEMNFALEKLKFPFTINGWLRDSATFEPLQANINFYDADADTLLARQSSNALNGKYSITLGDKYNVRIEISATDYYSVRDSFNAKLLSASEIKRNYNMVSSKITYALSGKVMDEENATPVSALILFYQPTESNPFTTIKTDSVGTYTIELEEQDPFNVEVRAEGYFFHNDTIQFTESDNREKTHDFALKKMKTGAKIVVENILFNSGKSTLKAESFNELDKLATLLIENSDVHIEVSGHTDNIGSATINKKISKARALSVRNYLITKGIEEERLEYEGYGFDQPIAPNNTAEGRAQNRRVEIKVLD